MGFKALLLLIIIILISLLFIQNLQPISLVFFGFNFPTFSLSLWLIVSLLAGIFSSLLIQGLSINLTPKEKKNQSFTAKNSSNYSPSTSQESFKDKVKIEKEAFSPPPMYHNQNTIATNQNDELDFDFDDLPEDISENNKFIDNNNPTPINNETSSVEIESPLSSEINPEKQIIDSTSENLPSETILKSREASLYSYKPAEKTEIKPNLAKSKPNNYRGNIYDAPYRVISPGEETKDEKINHDLEEEEDWDF